MRGLISATAWGAMALLCSCGSVGVQLTEPLSGTSQSGDTPSSGQGSTTGGTSSGGTSTGGTTGGTSTGGGGSTVPTKCTPTTDTWSNFGQQFFASNCVSCHSNFATESKVNSDQNNIVVYVGNDEMPPSNGLADPNERNRLVNWILCGAAP